MKKSLLIFIKIISSFFFLCPIHAMNTTTKSQPIHSFPGVTKINDDLYVGKVADDFYLAMERIDTKNVDMWHYYGQLQARALMLGPRLKYLPDSAGSTYFTNVLEYYINGDILPSSELWVAYASNAPITKKAELNLSSYRSNPNIEMFVTVITSPDALITSHMGISRTWEAANDIEQGKRKRQQNQSIHLHSFAAKISKSLDTKKVYMLTVPIDNMRNILLANLPNDAVFVGDDTYKKILLAAEANKHSLVDEAEIAEIEYTLSTRQFKNAQKRERERKKLIDKRAEDAYKFYQLEQKIPLLKTNPPRIIMEGEWPNRKYSIQTTDGANTLITFDSSTQIYQWLFLSAYADLELVTPYVLIDLEKLANATRLVPYTAVSTAVN